MNGYTWTKCVDIAITELNDLGLCYADNSRTVTRLNIQFRHSERLLVPFQQIEREPKLFNFSPEAKEDLIWFCNNKVKEGKLSTDAAYAEIKQVIIPRCYSKLLLDAGEAYRDAVPQLNELLRHLDIKNLSIATVWRWLNYLGFYY